MRAFDLRAGKCGLAVCRLALLFAFALAAPSPPAANQGKELSVAHPTLYRTNVEDYPKWQAWMRKKRPRLLVTWGEYDLSFDPGEPERYRQDVPKAEVHVLEAGHFALDTAADEIAGLVRGFLK